MALELAKMRGLSIEELDREENGLREAIWKLRLQRATGQLSDPHKVRRTRQDLARVLTIRREMELGKIREWQVTQTTAAKTDVRRKVVKVGVVTSDKMDKSIVVRVSRVVSHPLYLRYVRRSVQFMAHDESNQCKVGDTVEIVESRPLSKRKRWRLRRIVRAAVGTSS